MQIDLFSDFEGGTIGGSSGPVSSRRPPKAFAKAHPANPPEDIARLLEATGRFRVLRRLEHRTTCDRSEVEDGDGVRVGIIVDTETTGLDHSRDEIVEIGMVAFEFDREGIRKVIGTFEGMREPSRRLPPEIVRLTGLTDAELAGKTIDAEALGAFVSSADVVIAHNAKFDRPFCDRLHPIFASKAWACTATEVDWKGLGADDAKLGHLLASVGLFHGAHRALTDCYALLEVLASSRYSGDHGAFAQLVAAADRETYEIRAEGAPYSERSLLKERGYRWDPGTGGRPKCWYVTVGAEQKESELFFLRHEIYRSTRMPVVTKLTAVGRFKGQ